MAVDRDTDLESPQAGRAVELWSLVLRHLLLISFMTAAGVALGYLHFLRAPSVFSSGCSLLVRNESKSQSNPFQGADLSSLSQREQPHALLIVSPLVVEKALDKIQDNAFGDEASNRRLRDLPLFANLSHPVGHIISHLSARTTVQNGVENSDIINLTYRDSDAITTKAVIQSIVESYKDFLGESHKNVSKEVSELIEHARTQLLAQLRTLESDYTEFRQNAPLLFNGEAKATNIHKDRMAEIESARSRLRIMLTERRAEFQSINDALAAGSSREAITQMLQTMKPDSRNTETGAGVGAGAGNKNAGYDIFELMLQEQLLLQELGVDHPKVKSLQRKIAIMQDYHLGQGREDEPAKKTPRVDFLTVCLDAMRHEIKSIESKIVELDELYESERTESKSIAVHEVKNDYFKKEIERTEALYQRIMKRLDEINLLSDYGGYKTAVISPASIGSHISPVFGQSLLIGGLLGAAVGFGLGYLVEANDRTFRTPEEVSAQLGLPIVGHIPIIDTKSSRIHSQSTMNQILVTYFKPKSSLAESYRAIRTSLYFSTRGEQHKVIQVTSPNPGDGKSTLAANLSVSIAQSGKRVLLIDADFRRPRIHEIFGLSKAIGISSVISGDAELPDATQATEVENLWAMPCGPRPGNPSELLTSKRFDELLDVLREQYDFVIIDTPPLLAVTDPCAVAARVDGVLLTIRLSKRTRSEATKAVELLATVSANTLGIIVNGIGKRAGYGGGYGAYGRYSGYSGYAYQYREQYTYGSDKDNVYYANDESEIEKPSERRR